MHQESDEKYDARKFQVHHVHHVSGSRLTVKSTGRRCQVVGGSEAAQGARHILHIVDPLFTRTSV